MNCWLTSSLCRLRLCRLDSFNFYRFLKSNQNLHAEIFLQCSRYPAKTNFFLLEFTQEPDSSEIYSEQPLFKCSWLLAILNYFMLKLFFWVVLRTHRNHLNFKFTSLFMPIKSSLPYFFRYLVVLYTRNLCDRHFDHYTS